MKKGFDIIKNDIDWMPANVRTDSTLRGYLIHSFFALILRKWTNETDGRDWFKQEIFGWRIADRAGEIKVMILPDGQKITT
jgi:hypothetical protein